jgi:hypothetical protein
MAMLFQVAQRAKDLRFFRDLAARLQQLPNHDWTEWEWEWLGAMAGKPDSYDPSEKEREKLAQIYSYSELLSGWDGLAVESMVNACHRYRLDFPEEDSDFIVELYGRKARTVRKRQLRRLVNLYAESGESVTLAWSSAEPIREAL